MANEQGFQAGKNKGVQFLPDGGNAYSTILITGHSWSEQVDKLDMTHTGTGGIQALMAGILRGDGNVKGNWTNRAYANAVAGIISNNPPNINAGANGVIRFYLSATQFIAVPCMVIKVNYQTAVEGKVEYNFDVSLNYFAALDAAEVNVNPHALPV